MTASVGLVASVCQPSTLRIMICPGEYREFRVRAMPMIFAAEVPSPEHGHQPPPARYLPGVPCRAQAVFCNAQFDLSVDFSQHP